MTPNNGLLVSVFVISDNNTRYYLAPNDGDEPPFTSHWVYAWDEDRVLITNRQGQFEWLSLEEVRVADVIKSVEFR